MMSFALLLAAGAAAYVVSQSPAPPEEALSAEPAAAGPTGAGETEGDTPIPSAPTDLLPEEEPQEEEPQEEQAAPATPQAAPQPVEPQRAEPQAAQPTAPEEEPQGAVAAPAQEQAGTPRGAGSDSTRPSETAGTQGGGTQGGGSGEPLASEVANWEEPSQDEVEAATSGERRYEPTPSSKMTLTIDTLGVYDVPVESSDAAEALDRGVVHDPDTPFPWSGGAQKNVYLSGHRLGYEGTTSRLVFYRLDTLRKGDTVVLKDSNGASYTYRVTEMFVVDPDDTWVKDPVRGRDTVSLQTCTPYPTFEDRMIVRADRV
jgi:sortase A